MEWRVWMKLRLDRNRATVSNEGEVHAENLGRSGMMSSTDRIERR